MKKFKDLLNALSPVEAGESKEAMLPTQQAFEVLLTNWLDRMAVEARLPRQLLVAFLTKAGSSDQTDVTPLGSPPNLTGKVVVVPYVLKPNSAP